MQNKFELIIDSKLMEEMELITHLISPKYSSIGILFMKEKDESESIVIRIYRTEEIEGEYQASNEIGSYSFVELSHALEFIEHLPQMSAIDLMLLQNPIPLFQ